MDSSTSAEPLTLPIMVSLFVGIFIVLFVYDVYRSRSSSAAPSMLSELFFNSLMHVSVAGFAFAVVHSLGSWSLSHVWPGNGAAVTTKIFAVAAVVVSWSSLAFASVVFFKRVQAMPANPVPDFLRCDGEFVAPPGDSVVNPLGSWCGWIRFEGHGACRIQHSAGSTLALSCEWSVQGESLRIAVPLTPDGTPPPHAVRELFMRGGTVEGTIDVSLSESGASVCRFTFEPEEHANG